MGMKYSLQNKIQYEDHEVCLHPKMLDHHDNKPYKIYKQLYLQLNNNFIFI